jgi:L-arabinokinase
VLECDVGLAQRGALAFDLARTVERWAEHRRRFDELVQTEARFLRQAQATVVLGDVPPLGFAAAAEAGVPSVAVANFSWDWIYRHFAERAPELAKAADVCAAAYARCPLLLRLPFAGEMRAFPHTEDVPLVARRPRVSKFDARRRLGLPSGPLVLLSFGGLGLPAFAPSVLAGLPFAFLSVAEPSAEAAPKNPPPNVSLLEPKDLARADLGYPDVVGAADVVVTKPGYGIVSDAVAAGTPLVYTDRGDFPEYPVIVEGMCRLLPCAYVSNANLLEGRLQIPIQAALRGVVPPPPPLNGAEVVAKRLLALGC